MIYDRSQSGRRTSPYEAVRIRTMTRTPPRSVALATATGGRALLESNRPELLLAGLAQDLSTYYSLGFAPLPGDTGRQHHLSVTVVRPGVRVRHRAAWEPLTGNERLHAGRNVLAVAVRDLGGDTTLIRREVDAGAAR